MELRTEDLPAFVEESDRRGGPGSKECDAYWQGLTFRPHFQVDQTLDPFSDAYVEQQLALHAEISNRPFDQSANEHTVLDIDRHANAPNPYDHGQPGGLALHIERLSRALRFGDPRRGSRFLDMGCGWGLSAEVAAYCGLEITAVDVNPDFVELVNRRAQRSAAPIAAQQGMFDTFESEQRFSMILFYECFHHALRPWELLGRMKRHLELDGRIVLAGEPINDFWWKHWGLRLDLLSVYCIHKHGWLESGWTADFLRQCFEREGLLVRIIDHPDSDVGPTVVGSRPKIGRMSATEVGAVWQHAGWIVEAGFMTGLGESDLNVTFPAESEAIVLGFHNFHARPIRVAILNHDRQVLERELPPGRSEVELARADAAGYLHVSSEVWVPQEVHGNGDTRRISIHLEDVTFF